MDDSKMTLREWLGFKERVEYENAKWFGRFLGFLVVALTFILALALFAALARIVGMVFSSDATSIRDLGYVVLGAIGIPFAAWRTLVAQRQAHTAEQGLITDRISKAVEQLGADKTIRKGDKDATVPNLEVRIGGLFALERIKNDSPADHIQIMEILCSYIRENMRQITDAIGQNAFDKEESADRTGLQLREDIRIGFEILQRRSDRQLDIERQRFPRYRMDFSHTSFRGHQLKVWDLSDATFESTDLSYVVLRNVKLARTNLRSANLTAASLDGSDLTEANCDCANFENSNCSGTDFSYSFCGYVSFTGASLTQTIFYETDLCYSNLHEVDTFASASMFGMFISRCNMMPMDLSATDIDQKRLNDNFGYSGMKIPNGLTVPSHWPSSGLGLADGSAYQKWLGNPDSYIPPQDRA